MPSTGRASGVRSSKRVLIVDDSIDCADLLQTQLDRAGYETCVAHSAEEGVMAATMFRPHVAVLDIGLPNMDGYDLVAALREKAELEQCRFIAVTGYGDSLARRSREAGFVVHLVKP